MAPKELISKTRVYIMVQGRSPSSPVTSQIKDELHLKRTFRVLGPYDAVVEIEMLPDIYAVSDLFSHFITRINYLETVGACTTYLAVSEKSKPRREKPFAYILIDAAPQDLISVHEKVFKYKEVQEADIVLGPYDIIVEIVVKSWEKLLKVLNKIRATAGIIRTLPLVVIRE